MAAGADRRKHEREELQFPVDYSSVDAFFTEMATNINEGGMFIATESPAELGETVALSFQLPGLARAVEVTARVAWISEAKDGQDSGMGVEFLALTHEVRDTINDLVRRLREG